MTSKGTYLLVAAVAAAGLAVSGVSACACPAAAACCGPACADGTHRDSGPVEEEDCCGGDQGACALPDAAEDDGDGEGAPQGIPCSCRMSHHDPMLRKMDFTSAKDSLSEPLFRAYGSPLVLSKMVPSSPPCGNTASRALHVRLCVWNC